MNDESNQQGVPSWLINLAPVVAMIVAVAVAWGNLSTRLFNIEQQQSVHHAEDGHGDMLIRRAVIEQSLRSMAADMGELKKELAAMRSVRDRRRSGSDYYRSQGQASPP